MLLDSDLIRSACNSSIQRFFIYDALIISLEIELEDLELAEAKALENKTVAQ
jgi:hypothetical protein